MTTQVLDITTSLKLVEEMAKVSQALESLREKLILAVPAKYGSRLWWEQAEIEAKQDIKAGRTYPLKSVDDLDRPLKNLH